MTDSQRRRTTMSGLRGNRGRFDLATPPPAAHVSFKPEMVGTRYGWVTIISPEKRWNAGWNHCYVLTQCVSCAAVQWQDLNNLTSGKSKGCQNCSQPRNTVPGWLERRLTSAKQRCTNPKDSNYPRYGGRGIEFRFETPLEACRWILENVPDVRRDYTIDRIDNNGHYERGNIRFVPMIENQRNKEVTILPEYVPVEWPYARTVVTRMLSAGMTREEIIETALRAVAEKRKNWRGIAERLASMTS